MKFFLIADADTVLGFRYAGIAGRAVRDAAEARAAFAEAVDRPDVGILMITEAMADLIRDEVNEIRFKIQRPTVVELPGPDWVGTRPTEERKSLLEMVRGALGIRV